MRLYYFTTTENALSDIALKRIKVATFSDLNDPFELLALSLGHPSIRKAFMSWKETMARDIGILCFSVNWENPVLWSHYGSKHTGVCLGFDVDDKALIDVEYVHERINIPMQDDGRPSFDEKLMNRILRAKYEHWRYEEEKRILVSLHENIPERGLYFFRFSEQVKLSEIVLGPLCEIPLETMCDLVAKLYSDIKVTKAALAYKWYKVVAQRSVVVNPTQNPG